MKAKILGLLGVALASFAGNGYAATVWDESINGDFGLQNASSSVGTLTVGDNIVVGALVDDLDSFLFVVPTGTLFDKLLVTNAGESPTSGPNFYLNQGSVFALQSNVWAANWNVAGVATGQDLFLLNNFFNGASAPFGPGTYRITMSGVGEGFRISQYALNLHILDPNAVPEPGTLALLGLGLAGLGLSRRRRAN